MTAITTMEADGVIKELENVTNNLTKELGIVSWKVARKSKSFIAKQVTSELATKQKTVKEQIKSKRQGKTAASVQLDKSKRIPLRDFGARQTRAGVSYRVSKSRGRRTVQGAFQGPRPGVMNTRWKGRVFKRVGAKRLPIVQLMGPSPWGVFVKGKKHQPTVKQIRDELRKQMLERLRFRRLKQSGAI